MGGPLALDGRHLMGEYNNQAKDFANDGGALERRHDQGGVCAGCCIFVLGGKLKGDKNQK